MFDADLIKRLPPRARAKLQDTERSLSPTSLRMRYGDTTTLTTEDGTSRLTGASSLGQRLVAQAAKAERTYRAIYEAHFRSLADRSVDETHAFLRSARNAKRQVKDIDFDHEQLLQELDAESQRLADRKAGALKPPTSYGEALVDAEVRAMIRAEKDQAKAAALARAHPRAVATAPALTSGVPESLHASVADAYLRTAVPDVMAQVDDLSASLSVFANAMQSFNKDANSLIDFKLADSLEAGGNWNEASQEAA